MIYKPYQVQTVPDAIAHHLPVRYRYAETPAAPPSHNAVAAIPADLREELSRALLALELEQIMQALDKLALLQPEPAAALRKKANVYEFEQIVGLSGGEHDDVI